MKRKEKVRRNVKKCLSVKIKKLFPITEWLPLYGFSKLWSDIIAGLAVSLFVISHGLIHATVAGLHPKYGLYASFPSMFVYVFFGTCKDMNMGTTLITALLTSRYSINDEVNPQIASSLAFFVGTLLLIIAVFRLGFLVRLLSHPTISGFVTASVVLLYVIQISYLLGLKKQPRRLYQKVRYVFEEIENTNVADTVLGIVCFAMLLLMLRMTSRKRISDRNAPRWKKVLERAVFAIGFGRNAIVGFLAILASYLYCRIKGSNVFTTIGDIPLGLPDVQMPFRPIKISANQTLEIEDQLLRFGSGLAILPVIIILQTIAISKSLAQQNGYRIDTSQEILAAGMANVFVSFFSGFPVTASFTRSLVNGMSRAQTCFSGVVASTVVLLVIQFLGPVFSYLPYSALSSMCMASAFTLFDYKLVLKLWRINKTDFVVWLVTFLGCLYEFDVGIIAGVLLSLMTTLFRAFKPRLDIQLDREEEILTVAPKGGVWYTGVETVARKVIGFLEKEGCVREVMYDCTSMYEIDYTVVHGLSQLVADCKLLNVQVRLINVADGKVQRHLIDAGLIKGKPDSGKENTEDLVGDVGGLLTQENGVNENSV